VFNFLSFDRRPAVPSLKVPERFRAGIAKIGELSEAAYSELLESLKQAPPCENPDELGAWISERTRSITDADRRRIVTALSSMFRVQRNSGVSTKGFTRDVWESLSEFSPQLLTSIDESTLKSRLSELIGQTTLDLTSSRLNDIRAEVERSFCKARILTDLRPAFKADITELPAAMALLHTLQIGFHDSMGKHQEFYVTLDAQDLKKLKVAIERAEEKAKTIDRVMEKSGVKLY
jgi:hypothetical protein